MAPSIKRDLYSEVTSRILANSNEARHLGSSRGPQRGQAFPRTPFAKGEDPRRVHGRQPQQGNAFGREMKRCLLDAAEAVGNRMVAMPPGAASRRPSL